MVNEAALAAIERAICERYNVASLDGLGSISRAFQSARGGETAALHAALGGREMYQWRERIEAALAELDDTPGSPVEEASDEGRSSSDAQSETIGVSEYDEPATTTESEQQSEPPDVKQEEAADGEHGTEVDVGERGSGVPAPRRRRSNRNAGD